MMICLSLLKTLKQFIHRQVVFLLQSKMQFFIIFTCRTSNNTKSLLQSESDESLEIAVLEVFREFGTVFVKIRRDVKHMPFAFCQFTVCLTSLNF